MALSGVRKEVSFPPSDSDNFSPFFPGSYQICQACTISREPWLSSPKVGKIEKGKVVMISELVASENRLMGKLEQTWGWITIRNFETGTLIALHIVLMGFLHKQGRIVSDYQRRFFVLKNNGLLDYYAREWYNLRGTIDLKEMIDVRNGGRKHGNTSFIIETKTRKYYIKAKTAGQKELWKEALAHTKRGEVYPPRETNVQPNNFFGRVIPSHQSQPAQQYQPVPHHIHSQHVKRIPQQNIETGPYPAIVERPKAISEPFNPQALPPFWEAAIDPHTGDVYFVNHKTKMTTWDRPSFTNVNI